MKNANPLPPDWLLPDWPAIPGVFAVFTSRNGGVSQAPWDSLNLGDHVGDAPQAVMSNRQLFAAQLEQLAACPVTPHFLQQVHGVQVCQLPLAAAAARAFDACVSNAIGQACTIMVADCLPILIAHRELKIIGAAHAGWRGLAGQQGVGVVEQLWQAYCRLVEQQQATPHAAIAAATQVWLGPCIGRRRLKWGKRLFALLSKPRRRLKRAFFQGLRPASGRLIWPPWPASVGRPWGLTRFMAMTPAPGGVRLPILHAFSRTAVTVVFSGARAAWLLPLFALFEVFFACSASHSCCSF